MHTITTEKTVFSFDELTEEAKENARDWYRGCIEADELTNHDDWQSVASILGIEFNTQSVNLMGGGVRYDPVIYWSGFRSQGDGACFEGSYSYAKGAARRIRLYAPQDGKLARIADVLQTVQARNFYRLTANISRGYGSNHYSHSGTMSVDVERSDERELSSDAEDVVTDALRSFADWIYSQLEAQWEYLNSAEAVDESIACNSYEFDENGNIA